MSSAKSTTEATFDADVIKSAKPVLVDFWATWCGPCQALGPVLDDVAVELADKLDIVKVNADENGNLANQYGVRGLPTLLLFKNGEIVASKAGFMPKTMLTQWIQSNL